MAILLKCLLMLVGIAWLAQISYAVNPYKFHERRHAMLNDEDPDEDDEEGNGFEFEGLKGHNGLFNAFNWSRSELSRISLYHATAQHFKAAEMIEQKLAGIKSTESFPREQIQSFLQKFKTPVAVKQLFNKQQIDRIRHLHRKHRIREIGDIFHNRLMQVDPNVREEIMQYFTLPHRC